MTSQAMWEEIYLRFEPSQPVPFDHPEWHAERTYNPIEGILRKLSLPVGTPRILYLGTIGTGKSTELRRLAAARAGKEFVLLVDLVDYFDRVVRNSEALQNISSWEVCFLIGLLLYQAATERLGFAWDPGILDGLAQAWRKAAKATDTEVPAGEIDLAKLARTALFGTGLVFGGPGAGLVLDGAFKVAEKTAETLRWNLPIGRARQALPGDSEPSLGLLDSVNRIIGELQLRHSRVVLVIDGLDRIQRLDRVRQVFIETDLLARLVCPVVICGPFLLRHNPEVNRVRGFDPFVHVNEPVLLKDNPEKQGNGVAFFWELFRKRVQDLGNVDPIPHSLLLDLAYHSGGRARDFVRMVRSVAEEALASAETQPEQIPAQADGAIVDRVIDGARRTLEIGIDLGHINLLREIMADPRHDLPHHELVDQLLTFGWLLPYPNESEWFYPHPLLGRSKLR